LRSPSGSSVEEACSPSIEAKLAANSGVSSLGRDTKIAQLYGIPTSGVVKVNEALKKNSEEEE